MANTSVLSAVQRVSAAVSSHIDSICMQVMTASPFCSVFRSPAETHVSSDYADTALKLSAPRGHCEQLTEANFIFHTLCPVNSSCKVSLGMKSTRSSFVRSPNQPSDQSRAGIKSIVSSFVSVHRWLLKWTRH